MLAAGLVLAYLAGFATPITAVAWAYMTLASPPRRSRKQRRARHAPHDRTHDPRV